MIVGPTRKYKKHRNFNGEYHLIYILLQFNYLIINFLIIHFLYLSGFFKKIHKFLIVKNTTMTEVYIIVHIIL